jgi:hypothetical protein
MRFGTSNDGWICPGASNDGRTAACRLRQARVSQYRTHQNCATCENLHSMTDIKPECVVPEYMPEAAVSIRLAHWISGLPGATDITVALDRMHLWASAYTEPSTGRIVPKRVICDLDEYLIEWQSEHPDLRPWCRWRKANTTIDIRSATTPPNAEYTVSDIEAPFALGRLRIESKQVKNKVQEQNQLQSGIGQLVTIRDLKEDDFVAVAVPYSTNLRKLARRFVTGPLFSRTEIGIALVHDHGPIDWITPETDRWRAFNMMVVNHMPSSCTEPS